ncbi:oligosaccharide flippase family protein [Priestia aryabhattai]|uniref:oligosaccharide flippase family protein n=1 Tax=Priestia aryabhattai TaxID=412384 RepID=UPI001C8DC8AD|nr:polysaccharide biosynthesis C-terminal domain-containing protein [Priestia aryabhattai]MBX9987784.1 polysaccharide biosynthesis C-terminal domain-containing protein [Priestia aryabhattai]
MSKYKKLAINSIVFAIGNLGSKLISFLLLPLYTYYLEKNEFGTVDLLTTTLSLIIPIVTLSVFDAVLRFTMDKGYDNKIVLNNALLITLLGFIFSILLYPLVIIAFPFPKLLLYFYVLLLIQSINSSLSQFVRALGKIKFFSTIGIIGALTVLVGNIVFLVMLHWGIEGYLISLIFSNVVCFMYTFFFGDIRKYISISKANLNVVKKMLIYSIPLIPNALMWWIMSLSDRYIISFFLGLGANGLYAVASKIPNLLNVINSIFFQAWQMSAIEESESKNKSEFYTKIFSLYSTLLLVCASVMIGLTKFIMKFAVSDEYFEAWKYVPFLLLSIVFSSFSSFLGTNYIAAKNTTGIFKTSLWGAVINIVFNLILIPIIGINGAAVSTMLSFALIWILRIRGTKDYVNITINIKKIIIAMCILFIQITLLFINLPYSYLLQIILISTLLILNKQDLLLISRKFTLKLNQKKLSM